jgi:hypothetical protein
VHEPASCPQCVAHDAAQAIPDGAAPAARVIYDEYHRWIFDRVREVLPVDRGAQRLGPLIPLPRAPL